MKKILIIDDDNLSIKIINSVLKKEGYDIHIANDSIDAIEKIGDILPDLIITDIMMPYRSGLEILAFSKKNHPSIPIIMISTLGEEDLIVAEGFKLGLNDFITKPFNPIELILRVKRFV
jgi:two-component system response regulator VicR